MEDLATDEYMDIVTTYRCKFCNFTSIQPKDIALHVKAVHVKPRTIVIASSNQVVSVSDQGTSNNADSVVSSNNTVECLDAETDVVSRAVRESNLEVLKEEDISENEPVDATNSLESLIVEGTNTDQLNTILAYSRNEPEQNGQIVGYFSKGQVYTSLVPYQQDQGQAMGEQLGQVLENNVQVNNGRQQMTLTFVDSSNEKAGTDFRETNSETQQVKELLEAVLDPGEELSGNYTSTVHSHGLRNEANQSVISEMYHGNSNVQYVVQETANQTYNSDSAGITSETETETEFDHLERQEADITEVDNNNMHIIIENNNDASVRRISIDSETLKKSLESGKKVSETLSDEYVTVIAEDQSNAAPIDDTSVTTKELYLCGNCSAGFNTIQECKDHMLAEHGQYAEENLTENGTVNESTSSKVDVSTQVEPKKKPGRKKKSEVRTSPVTVKEEVVSDSGSDEDWSEKLNVEYSRSSRSRRKRRPPAALKNDYYLGKRVKEEPTRSVRKYTISSMKLPVKCSLPGCTAKFREERTMKIHLDCHIRDAPPSEPAFRCLYCTDEFHFWKHARYHMWKAHRVDMDLLTCEVCHKFKTDAPSKLKAHMEIHSSDKPYTCEYCGKGFRQMAQKKNHEHVHREGFDLHQGEGKWYHSQPCELCGRVFANAKCLKTHVEIVHGKEKPFKCTFCNHTCARKAMMELHIRIHTQEKPFKCDHCPYATGDHNSLRRHKMRHTGHRPYKCPHCPYSCIQAISLKVHIKNKHPGQEGVYHCHLCLYRTLSKKYFDNHLQDHKNGLVETLEPGEQMIQKAIRTRRQKSVIKPQFTSVSVHPSLLQQLQHQNNPPQSQIITLQASNAESASTEQQIIQLPSNPQVMQVEMKVETNADGENVISEEELAKLNNYEGLVQSDVAAAQLIYSALNAISQNAHQTLESTEGTVVEEIVQSKDDLQTTVVTEEQEGVTHTITFHLPESEELSREGTSNEQQGVTLVEVTDGVDSVELAQQIQSNILIAGQP